MTELRERSVRLVLGMVLLAVASLAAAATIGVNPPARSLTRERIARLPKGEQGKWLAYLERSEQQRAADKAALAAEVKAVGAAKAIEPAHGYGARSLPLDRPAAWYASAEARKLAGNVVSFQTPAGGWGKNLDFSHGARQTGERYVPGNLSRYLDPADYDRPAEPEWNYVGTIDNDATTTELQFLAKIISAGGDSAQGRAAFARGIEYLLAAQYPNGGWPQVWPLEGGYHDAITFNDDAMTQTIELLHDVAAAKGDFAFVSQSLRQRAERSVRRGIRCTLASQVRANGTRTVWVQQEDMLTLEPTSARNYEIPALSSGESATVLHMLMEDLPQPSAEERTAIRAAAAWFQKTAIYGQSFVRTPEGHSLIAKSGAGPLWSRYSQIGSNKPVFGDRDKKIYDNLNDLSLERRKGYRWFDDEPKAVLERFAQWQKEHPEQK